MVFLFFSFLFFYKIIMSFFYKTFFLSILFTLTIYWLYSVFVYLYNTSRLSYFTSAVNRFWRRGISLFWSIEIFLFLIYIYLFLNCSIETEWLAEQLQLFYSFDIFSKNWFKTNLMILFILFYFNLFYIYKNSVHNLLIKFSSLLSLLVILQLFSEEFNQFFLYNNMYWCNTKTFTTLESSWEVVQQKTPSLVIYQYSFILVMLKFWHSMFIYFFCSKDIYLILLDSSNRPRNLKYSYTNIYILWLFTFLPFLYFLKLYLNMFFSIPYYSFFLCESNHLLNLFYFF